MKDNLLCQIKNIIYLPKAFGDTFERNLVI